MSSILYFGGPILTMEEVVYAPCVLTEGDCIRFVGTLEQAELLCTASTKRVDLQGKTMLPAFLDAHSHLAAEAFGQLQVQLGTCANLEEHVVV